MTLFSDAIAGLRLREGRLRRDVWSSSSLLPIQRGSIDLVADLTASYETIYHTQPWVWASVNKLARSVGMLPLKTYERGAREARSRQFDGPLHELIRRPSPDCTPSYWKQHIVGSMCLWGNALAVKMDVRRPDELPSALMPAPAIGWAVGENDTYVWTSEQGQRYAFQRWQVVHFRYWNTAADGFGISALEPLRRTLMIEDAATRYGVAAFKNGVNPAAVVTTDETLSETVIARLAANIENLYGSVDQAFRVAVLEQGLDWKPLTHNLNDAAVLDHRKLTREEVAAAFDLPQPSVGILDEANFGSIDALNQMFWQGTLGPWLRMIEETIVAEVIDGVPGLDGQFVEFDANMMLRGTPLQRAEMHQRLYTSRVTTPNEMRATEGLAPITDDPTADQLYIAPGSNPALVSAPDAATAEGEN